MRRQVARVVRRSREVALRPIVRRLPGGERFSCPVCGHAGRFLSRPATTGWRRHAVSVWQHGRGIHSGKIDVSCLAHTSNIYYYLLVIIGT